MVTRKLDEELPDLSGPQPLQEETMAHTDKRSASSEMGTEEIKMEMTPMIDVTFLLLIFFLCSIKFRLLEGKLQTYLPKDVGPGISPMVAMLEKVDLRIERTEDRGERDLSNLQTYKQWVGDGGWKESQVDIFLQDRKVGSLKSLLMKLREVRQRRPAPVVGEDDDLKMNLEAMNGVIYEDVIRVVDVAIEAGFSSITFRGIALDA
ncbi:MAG: biopolymer transporter ExbD [Planctomycetota bacterium]